MRSIRKAKIHQSIFSGDEWDFPHPDYQDFSPERLPPLPTGEGKVKAFRIEQVPMQRLQAESLLPRLDLDISDYDIPGAVEKIADWLEVTRGL